MVFKSFFQSYPMKQKICIWTALSFLFFANIAIFTPAYAQEDSGGSGFPVPRFASLKSDNVYVRTGPSMDYPIKWIYKRDGLPIEIIQEFDAWRKIKDPDGAQGWVHKILLSGKKTARVVLPKSVDGKVIAYDDGDMKKPVVAFGEGVIIGVEACEKLVCRVKFAPYEGWVEKKYLWGIYGSDIFD